MYDCIVVRPLTDIPIDSEGEFVESDVVMDDSDEDNSLEERMQGLMFPS
jgi:hypothetical protein